MIRSGTRKLTDEEIIGIALDVMLRGDKLDQQSALSMALHKMAGRNWVRIPLNQIEAGGVTYKATEAGFIPVNQ